MLLFNKNLAWFNKHLNLCQLLMHWFQGQLEKMKLSLRISKWVIVKKGIQPRATKIEETHLINIVYLLIKLWLDTCIAMIEY